MDEKSTADTQGDAANDKPTHGAANDTPTHDAEKQTSPQEDSKSKGPPGGYDPTPLTHTAPGCTVKVIFHRAENLPMADLTTFSSDPYISAVITTSLPTRHKEDPPLRFRTKTQWKTTEPTFDEEWIIAHIPPSGFRLKARIFDEDSSDRDDRLGNVHVDFDHVDLNWSGIKNQAYKIEKRSGSWRAYALRAVAVCIRETKEMRGRLYVSVEVLGQSQGDGGRAYTIGPNSWCKHYSPLLGRIANSRNPAEQKHDAPQNEPPAREEEPPRDAPLSRTATSLPQPAAKVLSAKKSIRKGQKDQAKPGKFNFQANQIQLSGPVPEELYHRYVEFRPFIKTLFTGSGIRGILLNKALHHQHALVYNFNRSTEYGIYNEPCDDMTNKFLELVRWDEGGRIFTYVITLDALLRFTETGKEYGIDLLSKHTMHADADIYIAWSGEFFVRRAKHRREGSGTGRPTTQREGTSGSNIDSISHNPSDYELVIDNDSGTYRPNGDLLPVLRKFLEQNLPGLHVRTLNCQSDAEVMKKMKQEQRDRKKREGGGVIYTQVTGSESSLSSEEGRLDRMEGEADADREKSPKHKLGEAVLPFVNNPKVREHLMD